MQSKSQAASQRLHMTLSGKNTFFFSVLRSHPVQAALRSWHRGHRSARSAPQRRQSTREHGAGKSLGCKAGVIEDLVKRQCFSGRQIKTSLEWSCHGHRQ